MQRRQITSWALSLAIAIAGGFQASVEATPVPASSDSNSETIAWSLSPKHQSAVVTLYGAGGKGTGSIIKASGLVLTSAHIITDAHGKKVSVVMKDGTQYPGKVIATDQERDLALVKILSRKTFTTLPLADSNSLDKGETVYALADPFASLEEFTSGKLRNMKQAQNIYTDIVLSPGDSGGPLLNSQGEIIGVNRATLSLESSDQKTTLGLATHIAAVYQFLQQAQSQTNTQRQETPATNSVNLGITVAPDTLEIIKIEPNSLADQWGLQPGDQLVAYNYHHLDSLEPLKEFLATNPSEVLLFLRRNDYLVRVRRKL